MIQAQWDLRGSLGSGSRVLVVVVQAHRVTAHAPYLMMTMVLLSELLMMIRGTQVIMN